jgi:uncharacterized protein (TIGR03086 family)
LIGEEETVSPEQVDGLERALDATGQLVRAVQEEQWPDPTGCPGWNVRDLVTHIVSGNRMFTDILRGDMPGPPAGAPADAGSSRPASDLRAAYREAAAGLLAAFSQPGVMNQTFTVPFGTVPGSVALHLRITEVLVHGWDLAQATGQPASLPDDLAEQELAFSRSTLPAIPPERTPFGPPQPVSADAPAIDQLAALLGRAVTGGAAQT